MRELLPVPRRSAGSPPEAVGDFERRLEERRVRTHGYLILSHGAIAAERYWPPYGPDVNHRVSSVTRSFTALLVGEGKISLTDPVRKYLPDKLSPAGPHLRCVETTVEARRFHGFASAKKI